MMLSDKFAVPCDIALLYDFVNSLDLRRYVEQGTAHIASDELATPEQLDAWLRMRNLSDRGARPAADDHQDALALRATLRSFLELTPSDRATDAVAAARLNAAAANFPLFVTVLQGGGVALRPSRLSACRGLGGVLAEFQRLAETERLGRVKACASDECGWIFYDRSKPGNRRWCSSTLCGNRQKTRSYRDRRRRPSEDDPP
jgi:predicted RNA-binding Zn ribbon-like protein